ncbi:MAG: VOC family protein [Thermomicrobiales bacterium]
MAYRFVLEVPEADRKPAEAVVGAVPDTQILVSRLSFAEGFDRPYAALTIASEQVRVVQAIVDWMRIDGKTDARIVLLDGQRIPLAARNVDDIVAEIRTTQPWGDRAVPRIGDHTEEKIVTHSSHAPDVAIATPAANAITIENVNLLSVNVMDLRKAEEFYREFFGLQVVGRATYDADGKYRMLADDYDWDRAIVTETVADESFVRNGDLILGLHRVGSGARLERTNIDRISIQVDGDSYRRIKAKVLVNSLELLGETQASFKFRDPFGVPWEVALPGLLPQVLQSSLGS